jgi:serine/threonine-protein kinase
VTWSSNDIRNMVVGSGVPTTKTWDIAGFTSIRLGSTFHGQITRGEKFKVTTTSDNNLVEHLRVVKEGKTLRIDLQPGWSYKLVEPLKAEVVLPELEGLEAGGASKASIGGFRSANNLKVTLHGASSVEGSIEAADVDFDLSGASGLSLTGLGRDAQVSASGASHLRLKDFPFRQGKVRLSGASDARIAVQSGEAFQATVGDSSKLEGSVDVKDLSLKVQGASSATLKGKANAAILEGKSTSHLNLANLALDEATVDLSGVSQASVHARKRLHYMLSSLSRLNYAGSPSSLTGTKTAGASLHRQP